LWVCTDISYTDGLLFCLCATATYQTDRKGTSQ